MKELTNFTKSCIMDVCQGLNPLSPIPIKWSNTLKQFVGSVPTNCLRVTILWG